MRLATTSHLIATLQFSIQSNLHGACGKTDEKSHWGEKRELLGNLGHDSLHRVSYAL